MGEPREKEPRDGIAAWRASFEEQLKKHPDPSSFQLDVIRILTDLLPVTGDGKPRAIDKHQPKKRAGFLSSIYGDSARVRVLESLLQYPDDWFNITDLATIAGTGKASAKRVIDIMLTREPIMIDEEPAKGPGKERLVKLKDTPLTRELRFFYVKIRGML